MTPPKFAKHTIRKLSKYFQNSSHSFEGTLDETEIALDVQSKVVFKDNYH